MSLVFSAIRVCLVQALRQADTLAGDRVRDSEIGPLGEGDHGPALSIYTDAIQYEPGEILTGSRGDLTVTITASVTAMAEISPEEFVIDIPPTDEGLELMIDAMLRQAKVALADPENGWAALFQRFCEALTLDASDRGSTGREGVRFAARELRLRVTPTNDPQPGKPLPEIWADLLTECANSGDPDLVQFGGLMASLAATPSREAAALQRAILGIPPDAADALLLTQTDPQAIAIAAIDAALDLTPPGQGD